MKYQSEEEIERELVALLAKWRERGMSEQQITAATAAWAAKGMRDPEHLAYVADKFDTRIGSAQIWSSLSEHFRNKLREAQTDAARKKIKDL